MTTLQQIEANRRNAQSSTGPRTEASKKRASRNAVRHGLTAETVIHPLEDAADYRAFEEAVTASFEPVTAVERELILRLASLLWRLRRATSIETTLFQMEIKHCDDSRPRLVIDLRPPSHLSELSTRAAPSYLRPDRNNNQLDQRCEDVSAIPTRAFRSAIKKNQIALAWRFLNLTNLAGDAFDRLGRYEAALWRQVRQTLFTLEGFRHGRSAKRYRRSHYRWDPLADIAPERDVSEDSCDQ